MWLSTMRKVSWPFPRNITNITALDMECWRNNHRNLKQREPSRTQFFMISTFLFHSKSVIGCILRAHLKYVFLLHFYSTFSDFTTAVFPWFYNTSSIIISLSGVKSDASLSKIHVESNVHNTKLRCDFNWYFFLFIG